MAEKKFTDLTELTTLADADIFAVVDNDVDTSKHITASNLIGSFDTDDLSEGTSNLYYTDERVDDRVNNLLTLGDGLTSTYDDTGNTLTIDVGAGTGLSKDSTNDELDVSLSSFSTDDLSEGTSNLYYTDERVDDRVDSLLSLGAGLTSTYDDTNNSLSINLGAGTALSLDSTNDEIDVDESASLTWTGTHDFTGGTITVPSPSSDSDAADKEYVDSTAEGLDWKDSARAATDGTNIDLTSSTDPNPIDGVTLSDGDRVLLKDQTDASENGIYDAVTATDPTTWVRSDDADEDSEVNAGMTVWIEEGDNNADEGYVLTTNDPITVDTTNLSFTGFSTSALKAGDGVSKSGNTLNVDNAASGGLKFSSSSLAIEPSDFAGSFLSDDGSDNLQVDIGRGLEDDGNGNIQFDEDTSYAFTADLSLSSADLTVSTDIIETDQANNRVFTRAPASDPGSAAMGAGQLVFWLDETNDNIEARALESDGSTDVTATIGGGGGGGGTTFTGSLDRAGAGLPSESDLVTFVEDSTDLTNLESIDTDGSLAVVTRPSDNAVTVLDVSDRQNPTVEGSVSDSTNLASAHDVKISGNHAIVTTNTGDRVTSVDISTPSSPTVADSLTDTNLDNVRGLDIDGNHAFISSGAGDALVSVDISDPTAMSVADTLSTTELDAPRDVVINGSSQAFVACVVFDGMVVVDVSDPTNMSQSGSVTDTDLDGAAGIEANGTDVFVACAASDKLTTVDASTASSPTVEGSVQLNNVENTIFPAHQGDHVFLPGHPPSAAEGDQVYVAVNVADLTNPTIETKFETDTFADASGMAINNDLMVTAVSGSNAVLTSTITSDRIVPPNHSGESTSPNTDSYGLGVPIDAAGSISNLRVHVEDETNLNTGDGVNVNVTRIQSDGTTSDALTATVSSPDDSTTVRNQYTDTSSVSVSAGDTILVKLDGWSGSWGPANISWSFDYNPD